MMMAIMALIDNLKKLIVKKFGFVVNNFKKVPHLVSFNRDDDNYDRSYIQIVAVVLDL